LAILQVVERFGRLPLAFLYRQVPASAEEIDRQVRILAAEGAVKLEGDDVVSRTN
jgi:hypothetical protein